MNTARVVVCYSGRVQGVGFRYTVKSLVRGYEVCGTIRNQADGGVQLVAEGEREELKVFLQAVRDSGLRRFILSEEEDWSGTNEGLKGFEIIG